MAEETLDFHKIHDEYRPKVRRYLARLAGEHEADDLTQEVFVKISRSLSGFKGESSLSTWIYKVATNTALDRFKSPAYRQEACTVPSEAELAQAAALLSDGPLPADQQLIRDEMNDCIRGVVDGLPPDYRTVIALSEIHELKDKEIAEVLGVSLEAAKIRLHRARAALKDKLEDKCSFYRDGRNEFACEPKITTIKFKDKK